MDPFACARARKAMRRPGPGAWRPCARRSPICRRCPPAADDAFPPVLAAWDDTAADPPRVGYEMPFYGEHVDAGALARRGALAQGEIDLIQEALAEVVLERVHPARFAASEPLGAHLLSVVEHALGALEADPALGRLVRAEAIRLNGASQAGPRTAFRRAVADGALVAALDAEPQVRLHGDLFLENMLWRTAERRRRQQPAARVDRSGVRCGRDGWPAPVRSREVRVLRDRGAAGLAIRVGGGGRVRRKRRLPISRPLGQRGAGAVSKARLAHALSPRLRSQVRPRRSPRLSPHRRLLQRGDGRQYGWDAAPRPPTQGHAGLQRRRGKARNRSRRPRRVFPKAESENDHAMAAPLATRAPPGRSASASATASGRQAWSGGDRSRPRRCARGPRPGRTR